MVRSIPLTCCAAVQRYAGVATAGFANEPERSIYNYGSLSAISRPPRTRLPSYRWPTARRMSDGQPAVNGDGRAHVRHRGLPRSWRVPRVRAVGPHLRLAWVFVDAMRLPGISVTMSETLWREIRSQSRRRKVNSRSRARDSAASRSAHSRQDAASSGTSNNFGSRLRCTNDPAGDQQHRCAYTLTRIARLASCRIGLGYLDRLLRAAQAHGGRGE